jgi:SAM-dependent methyltransferase
MIWRRLKAFLKMTARLFETSAPGSLKFICNICGNPNSTLLSEVESREQISCSCCGSTLRFRSVVAALQDRLGKGIETPLSNIKADKTIKGLGMSDASIYAEKLADKYDYTNSFYHTEPFLDITKPPIDCLGAFDFIVSSDVMEHVAPPVHKAFENLRALLKPGGVLILSVPYSLEENTIEHFPNLHDYKIDGAGANRVLRNLTIAGQAEAFSDLVFHGGDGSTLEMRSFSQNSLIRTLENAGFVDIKIQGDNYPAVGIVNRFLVSLTISARAG